jgi:hypothetical protein
METCSLQSHIILNEALAALVASIKGSEELVEAMSSTNSTEKAGGGCQNMYRRLFAASFISLLLGGITCLSVVGFKDLLNSYGNVIPESVITTCVSCYTFLKQSYNQIEEQKVLNNPKSYWNSWMDSIYAYRLIPEKYILPVYSSFLLPSYMKYTDRVCDIFNGKSEVRDIGDILGGVSDQMIIEKQSKKGKKGKKGKK